MKNEEMQDLQDNASSNYVSDLGFTRTTTITLPALTTQSGFTFESIDVNFMTLGELSPEKDNAILICHALTGNAHVAGIDKETGKPGWWDFHVGPGKTFDTNRFFIIATSVIGTTGGSTAPASLNPATGKPYGMNFPPITIRDMVLAQVKLVDHLGIDKLFAVAGGSMGGMQALVWAADYASRVHLCLPIATCMAHSATQIAFNEVGRQAILTDPEWNQGDYYHHEKNPEHGLAVARMVGHITYLSEYSMKKKFGRKIQRPSQPEDLFPMFFSVESYLQYQGASFVKRFDPNSYLYVTKALDMFDLLDGHPAAEVIGRIQARFLVVSFESDWLYPPAQSKELVRNLKRMGKKVTYLNLDTPYGHDSFLIKNPEFNRVVANFLISEYKLLQEAQTDDDQ